MKIVWSIEAIDDLQALRAYIGKDSPRSAQHMAFRIIDAVESLLGAHPKIGRPGRVEGTRELVVSQTPYVVPYRFNGEAVLCCGSITRRGVGLIGYNADWPEDEDENKRADFSPFTK